MSDEGTPEPRIKASINGLVEVSIPEEDEYLAHDARQMALDLLDASFQSSAAQAVDLAMHEHRRQWIPGSPEWLLLDAAWRDLRKAFGVE